MCIILKVYFDDFKHIDERRGLPHLPLPDASVLDAKAKRPDSIARGVCDGVAISWGRDGASEQNFDACIHWTRFSLQGNNKQRQSSNVSRVKQKEEKMLRSQ